MMNCSRAVELFSAYLDGDPGAAEKDNISSHLKSCPSCEHKFKLYKRAWQVLDAFPQREPSPGFLPTVAERIRRERPSPLFFFRPAWALTVILILSAACFTLFLWPAHRIGRVSSTSRDILTISAPLEESNIAGSAIKIKLGGNIGEIHGLFSDESKGFLTLCFE
ncbi:MAG: zf-HC2 domain-containing protein [bacterium]